MSQKRVDQINYLNIGLMLLSGALAMRFPFALFLFAYAVLGPLHYLTEISWLHDRKYFAKGRHDHFILGGLCLGMLLVSMTVTAPNKIGVAFIYMAFAAAGVFTLTPLLHDRIRLIGLCALGIPFVANQQLLLVIFGVLLPSIIHVFLFTGLFILAGTIRQKSVSGTLSLIAFLVISAGLLLWRPEVSADSSHYVRSSYGEMSGEGIHGFMQINYALLNMLMPSSFPSAGTAIEGINDFLYGHPAARAVMAFIAFSYTYHYLNWFSKTSVIGWHKVPKKRLGVILAIWGASLGLYATDYGLGARWLYALSFLHVILEFPLNHLTIRSIAAAIYGPRPVRA